MGFSRNSLQPRQEMRPLPLKEFQTPLGAFQLFDLKRQLSDELLCGQHCLDAHRTAGRNRQRQCRRNALSFWPALR